MGLARVDSREPAILVTYAFQIATSAPRPGRRFEPVQERALHGVALAAAEALPGASRGLVVVPEFAGPIGIPDFTAYVGSTANLTRRQRLAVPPITNDVDAALISVASARRAQTAAEFANALGWPESTIAGRFRRLAQMGALLEDRSGRYVRPIEIDANGRLYAVEAKIADWRKALRQVRTYRVWADAYVLVMSGLTSRGVESLLTEVERDRGGLVVDGRWLARPRIEATDKWRRLQAMELFAAGTKHGLRGPAFA